MRTITKIDRQAGSGEGNLLSAVAEALRVLLEPGNDSSSMHKALAILGEAARVDRVYVFENHESPLTGELLMSQQFEWCIDGVTAQMDNPLLQALSYDRWLPRWKEVLGKGLPVAGLAVDFPESEKPLLDVQDIIAIAVVPILIQSHFWGFIGFDVCSGERVWAKSDLEILQAAAAGIGGAIIRQKSDQALREANESLQRQAEELRKSRKVALSLIEDARRAEQKAAAANEAKSAFLAVMSHEMRTPLNGMLGFADLILHEQIEQPIRGYVETIRRSGEILLTLIADILDLSKIESGNVEIREQPCDILAVTRSVIESFEQMAESKEVRLTFSVESSAPPAVQLDALRFRQVLTNLIGNALKFTERGRIHVSLSGEARIEAPDRLRLICKVTDTGIGIDGDDLKRIFEPFSQANAGVHRKFGGTGLGLTICRKLCRLMGGDIDVQSTPGQGSTFTFHVRALKLDEAPAQMDARTTNVIPLLSAKIPMSILVVDDVSTNRELLGGILRRMGYSPESAVSGEQAVEKVLHAQYDLVFMDVLMPGIDGCEAARRIREIELGRGWQVRCRIVALSADAMPENRARCIEAGMDAFLTKPLQIAAIADAVRDAAM